VAALLFSSAAAADRSRVLRAEFQRANPCPSTGSTRGACPGYQVDHLIALCLTGPNGDIHSNLQWLSIEAHKRKTVDDVRMCRSGR
jgi:hypothetical protein